MDVLGEIITPIPANGPYYNLGGYHRAINTNSPDAQIWFNRGLIWTYAFHHEEAVQCFKQALAHDPKCLMAYWGVAYAVGPNYNKGWDSFDDEDKNKSLEMVYKAENACKPLRANAIYPDFHFHDAIFLRYPRQDGKSRGGTYLDKMAHAYKYCVDDVDVAALYADALMNENPWDLWDIDTGQPAEGAKTLEIKDILEKAFKLPGGAYHPGLLHLYIHLMEMSPTPESALNAADNLRNLVPDGGHLQHMPTHIDILCGDYRRAISSNQDAISADNKYFANNRSPIFYTLYRCHNLHFKTYAAMLCGRFSTALLTAASLESVLSEELLRVRSPPMADWLEGFWSIRVHVLVRFGRWDDILALEVPADRELFCMTTAMIHYGKGIAYASKGKVNEAILDLHRFEAASKAVPTSRTLFNNTCQDILKIAKAMLQGEIKYRRGLYEEAFKLLEDAIDVERNLPYDEPWGWMQPVRHAYGALLLEQGRVQAAEKVYREDLGFSDTLPRALRHPNNVWALQGYYECLRKLGKTAEVSIIQPQLKLALAVADVPVNSSCFCRRNGDG
ncbi:TPR domain protein [Microthyrium microscopicum]|uniref:TPR domain protein n=1 Tax=Microthyrium microscopicum TaxID=703497 RepID=A0A6A6U438_9PEZI|nr:TPR domain protein [Microthyrium microscopicum]